MAESAREGSIEGIGKVPEKTTFVYARFMPEMSASDFERVAAELRALELTADWRENTRRYLAAGCEVYIFDFPSAEFGEACRTAAELFKEQVQDKETSFDSHDMEICIRAVKTQLSQYL